MFVPRFARHVCTLFALILVAGCGGGSASSVSGAEFGTVGLTVTDNPIATFDEILVTFSCAALLGEDEPVALFEGSETFDLLSLRDVTELFVVADDVPVGTYNGIRLCVEEIELVSFDDNGIEIFREVRQLPGNGRLDLEPRGEINLGPDETVLVQLDWDAEKSIRLNGGGPDEILLRPVVFAETFGADRPDPDKVLRLHGTIAALDREARELTLCQTHFLNSDGRDAVRDGCVNVVLEDDASLFSADGDPVTLDDVVEGEESTVFGRVLWPSPLALGAGCDDDPDSAVGDCKIEPLPIAVAAGLLELGPKGTFAPLSGVATGGVDSQDRFPFELDPGQGFVDMTTIPVQLSGSVTLPGTKILDAEGAPASPGAIEDGVRLLVRGVISLDPNRVKASLVAFQEAVAESDSLSGVIVAVESDGSGLRLLPDDASIERCVVADADTETFLISETEDGTATSEMLPLTRALETLDADVYGKEGVDGCFNAATIIAFDAPFPGQQ